jgi:hypothetical protein
MPEEKDDLMRFQLRAIELHERSLVKPAPGFTVTNFHFNINIESNVDTTQKIVLVLTKVKIFGDDQTTELGSLTSACVFSLGNFDAAVKLQPNNSFELPEGLADILNAVALSTTRGIMFSEFKGTLLHHAFLPIVDIKSLKKELINK